MTFCTSNVKKTCRREERQHAAKSRNAHLTFARRHLEFIINWGHPWLSYDNNELVKWLSIKVLLYPLSTSVVYFYCQLGSKHAIKSFLY
jgi:hypothetical protein